jgi:hypothetical protein
MGVRHIRVEHFGTLVGGAEAWSTGHQAFAPVGIAPVDDYALTAMTLWSTLVAGQTDIRGWTPSSTVYVGCRVRQVSAAGVTEAVATRTLATPIAGNAGTLGGAMPPECSIVVSLQTQLPGGRGRGRAYYPGFSVGSLTSTGRLQGVARDVLATGWKNYLDGWNADPTALAAGVASVTGGFVTAIDRIRVGDVVDTQRRRRDALTESYKVLVLA